MALLTVQQSLALSVHLPKLINTESVVESRVKMECSRNPHVLYPVDWEFAPAGSNSFSYIYTGKRITESLWSKYKIDTNGKTRYDIVHDSVDLSHAGAYRWTPITEEFNVSSYTAELIVLDYSFEI